MQILLIQTLRTSNKDIMTQFPLPEEEAVMCSRSLSLRSLVEAHFSFYSPPVSVYMLALKDRWVFHGLITFQFRGSKVELNA